MSDDGSSDGQNRITVEELGNSLFECADELRGSIDKGRYKDFILPLVFHAGVSRQFDERVRQVLEEGEYETIDYVDDKLVEQGGGGDQIKEEIEELIYQAAEDKTSGGVRVPKGYHWRDIRQTEEGMAVEIDSALDEFEEKNSEYEGAFQNAYSNIESFTDTSGDSLLSRVVEIVHSSVYQTEKEIPPDVMGEAFMYLVKRFAEEEAGEYFTPPRVVRLVVSMIEPFEPETEIHDPTIGSGGMLVEVVEQIEQQHRSGWYEGMDGAYQDATSVFDFIASSDIKFSGQEKNPTIAGIAKMNLALHGIDGRVERGDSLTDPKFTSGDSSLEEFDYILANFPFSENGWQEGTDSRAGVYGDMDWHEDDKLPHGSYGDFAFIMHMESHLDDEGGQLATVAPHGVLFRNGDQPYRKKMVEQDWVEAVVGLPENMFESTGIPAAILVLNKDKPEEREEEVMFMSLDHEDRFYRDTGSNRHRLIDPIADGDVDTTQSPVVYADMENPTGVAEAKQLFEAWDDEERVCRTVDTDEIEENDYNMNIALYVDTTEPQDDIDVTEKLGDIQELESEYQELNNQLQTYMQQLKYDAETEGDIE